MGVTLKCAAVVLALLSIGAATPAFAKVIGRDSRIQVPSEYEHLLRGIGILHDTVTNSRCTAFCVAPDVILTSAHCVAWKLKRQGFHQRDVRDFVFRILAGGRQLDKETLVWNKIEPTGRPELSLVYGREPKGVLRRKANDWALAKLYHPLCAGDEQIIAHRRDFQRLAREGRQRVFNIGFHLDIIRRKKWSWWEVEKFLSRCQVQMRAKSRLIAHNCDTAPISSGSPIFILTPKGPRVVAIHQGWRRYRRRHVRGGKKKVTKRWADNDGVLLFGLAEKARRLSEVSFVRGNRQLGEEQLVSLLRSNGVLKTRPKKPNLRAVQAAIRRFEKKQGWVPLGIPSAQLIDALTAHATASSR